MVDTRRPTTKSKLVLPSFRSQQIIPNIIALVRINKFINKYETPLTAQFPCSEHYIFVCSSSIKLRIPFILFDIKNVFFFFEGTNIRNSFIYFLFVVKLKIIQNIFGRTTRSNKVFQCDYFLSYSRRTDRQHHCSVFLDFKYL